MQTYFLTLDLKNDPALISEYIEYHKNVWPEIKKSITDSGITSLDIYRWGTRMVLKIDANDDFSFEIKSKMDAANPKVQEWEELMWKFQQALPGTKPGEKWVLMDKIFEL